MNKQRKMCQRCFQRQAKFKYRGKVKWDDQHDMCMQCFRSCCDSFHAVMQRYGRLENLQEMQTRETSYA
jgi:hypothetical protein